MLQAGRRAAVGRAFGAARGIQQFDGVAHQAAVACHVDRDESLHARVAGILQLLVVRAIHVGFVGAETRGAPAGVEDFLNLGGAGVKAGLALEWITGVDALEIVDGERLILRFDGEPEIAPGAPPERLEAAARAAIGNEDVVRADELLACDFVAVALIAEAWKPQRLRIAQVDPGVFPAANGQLRITGGQKGLVVEQGGFGVWWDFMRRTARTQHRNRLRRQFHRRNGAWHQHPTIRTILRIARRARAAHDGGRPPGVIEIGSFPAPGIEQRFDSIAGAGHVVETGHLGRARCRRIGRIADTLPLFAGIHDALGCAVALEQETGLSGDLGFGRQFSEIPDDGGQHIPTSLQTTGDIHRFIAPMMQIAARRPQADQLAIDIQLIAIVGGDMNQEGRWRGGQIECAPEVIDAVVKRRLAGIRDPVSAPRTREQLRVGGVQSKKT